MAFDALEKIMKTGKVLKVIFMALCMSAFVSCGSDNKSDSGNVTNSSPQNNTPTPVTVNLSGENQYRAAHNLTDVKNNIQNGHFVKVNFNSGYFPASSITFDFDEYNYSCSVSTSKKDFLWWDDAINVSKTNCSNNSNQYFERTENSSGAITSAYGSSKLEILRNLYAIADTAQSAQVSMNHYGEFTIARIIKGSKMYIIDFGQPISANPVAEYDSDNGSIQGYTFSGVDY
jgi:hypothetical protein